MTGYTVHTGSSEDFASGWDRVFGQPGERKPKADKKKAKASGGRKPAKKTGKKK